MSQLGRTFKKQSLGGQKSLYIRGSGQSFRDSEQTMRGSGPTVRGSGPTVRGSGPTVRGSGQTAGESIHIIRGGTRLTALEMQQLGRDSVDTQRDSIQAARRYATSARQSSRGSQLRREEKRALHERILFGGQTSEIEMRRAIQIREYRIPKSRFVLPISIEKDLQEAFNVFDAEKSGVIKPDDLRIALRCLGFEPKLKDIDSLIDIVGQLKSKRLSFKDFQYIMKRTMTVKDTDDELRSAFKLISMETDSTINFEKLKKVNILLGESLTDEELKEMINLADKNKSGNVTEDEFMEFCGGTVLWDYK